MRNTCSYECCDRKPNRYGHAPLLTTIEKLVHTSGGEWKGCATAINEACVVYTGRPLVDSSRQMTKRLDAALDAQLEQRGIFHFVRRNGSGSAVHVFRYYPAAVRR